jgi:TPR repeat protein
MAYLYYDPAPSDSTADDARVQKAIALLHNPERKDQHARAQKMLLAAAQRYHVDAMYELARCYEMGKGVRRNVTQAFNWYRKAMLRVDSDAVIQLEGLAPHLNPALQQRLTREALLLAGAFHESAEAAFKLAESLYFEPYADDNRAPAAYWYNRAAQNGHEGAMYALAHMLLHSLGIAPDVPWAIRTMRRLAKEGHPAAMYQLAAAYDKSLGVRANEMQSMRWLKLSAASGYWRAVNELERQQSPKKSVGKSPRKTRKASR